MKTRIGWLGLSALLIVAAAAPAVAEVSVGSNFGVVVVRSAGSSSLIAVGWPGNSLAYAPGMRVGFGSKASAERFYLDSGMLLLSGSGSTLTTVQLSANYQHNFRVSQLESPYVTIGVGIYSIDASPGSGYTVPSFGVGVGGARSLSGGHGDFRTEFHIEHLSRDDSHGVPAVTTIGLKLGFDLWLE